MRNRVSMRDLPTGNGFGKGDVFVLFGELFDRGYASGLVAEARAAGMEILGVTVGRRTETNALRPLTPEELSAAEANLGGRIVNVPLMAGFELDAPEGGPTPRDIAGQLNMKTWREQTFDWDYIDQCREIGVNRFRNSAKQAFSQLSALIPPGRNVFFAHTMAGGILKTKIFLALASRIYKGRGDRFMSSNDLIASDLGKLVLQNFDEVTANTFGALIDGTEELREKVIAGGHHVSYSAYGYHGTEILIDDAYQWQSYTNYTQGYAKMKLEDIAADRWARGVKAVVFNCPEIRTNSSDIFTGVELPLFSLLAALRRENGGASAEEHWRHCEALLAEGATLDDVMARVKALNDMDVVKKSRDFEAWPMPNDPELAECVIGTSEFITGLHKTGSELITDYLSALVVRATGSLMFREMRDPHGPVLWLNHDIVAKSLNATRA